MIVVFFACAILAAVAVAGWICDRMDAADQLEKERRRRQAIRRCVQRAQQQQRSDL